MKLLNEQPIRISLSNILLIVGTGLLLVLLWQLQSLLLALMIAVVLAAAIAPIVNRAESLGIPRFLGVILVFLTLITLFVLAGLLIGPKVAQQIQLLIGRLPIYLENLQPIVENLAVKFGINQLDFSGELIDIQALANWVIGSSQQVVLRSYSITRGILGGVFNLILAVLLSGYMVADSQNLIKGVINLFPEPWDLRLAAQVKPVSQRMGGYIQGRVLVSAILGVVISFGLGILGLSEFALGLGVIAGATNLIPFFGPILGAVPALIVALAQGGLLFVWVFLLFVIIQNLETYVLDPLLVGSSVRVHPLYQLLAVLGGTQVLGIVGALIVPPWVAGGGVLLENLYLKPKLAAGEEATAREKVIAEQLQPDDSSLSGVKR